MKKKPVHRVECEYRVDFVHVIPATIYMVMSQGFEKTGIPEGAVATGLHLFEDARDIVSQFSSEPSPVVQKLMPPEKPVLRYQPDQKDDRRETASAAIPQRKDSQACKQPWNRMRLGVMLNPLAFATTPMSVGMRLRP